MKSRFLIPTSSDGLASQCINASVLSCYQYTTCNKTFCLTDKRLSGYADSYAKLVGRLDILNELWLTIFLTYMGLLRRNPIIGASPGGSAVKNLSAMQETQEMWVRSLDWEDPLEKEIAIHSSILARKIP